MLRRVLGCSTPYRGVMYNSEISFIGQTNTRQPYQTWGIKQADRLSHLYLIGRTGVGKSTLLYSLARQDIAAGRGLIVIDPHGSLATSLVAAVPHERQADLVYVDAADMQQPYGYNPLRRVHPLQVPLAVAGFMEACKMLWGKEAWGQRMEHVLRQALFALIECGDATLPDILRLFVDKAFRRIVLTRVRNDAVRTYWQEEYAKYHPRYQQEAIAPLQNKIGALLADPRLHRLFTSAPVELRFGRLMDERKILIINLSRGRLGTDSANLLGAMFVTTIALAAFTRSEAQAARTPSLVYIDEFQSFTTASVAGMVSELRKFGVGLTLAHQHLTQLSPDVRAAVLGNVGSLIAFRLGADDAPTVAREFAPTFGAVDLLNLPQHNIYVKLQVDGAVTPPFSATTMIPPSLN